MQLQDYLKDEKVKIEILKMLNEYMFMELQENHVDIINGDKDNIIEKVLNIYAVNNLILNFTKKV